MSERDVPIKGHDYDGIQELNNPLPKWWLATFVGAIIFAIVYYVYFQLGPGPSSSQTLERRMESVKAAQSATTAAQSADDANYDIKALLADKDALAVGKEQFMTICVACHGEHAEGSVGPNLTDDYWIHSRGDLKGILQAIRNGFPEKGMPPWGAVVPPDAQAPLAAYVISLRGTNPPNAKAPQGQYVPRE